MDSNCLLGGFLLNPSSGDSKYSRSLAKTTLSTGRLSDESLLGQSAMYTQTHLALYAPINVNPVGGGSAGKGWGFDKF